VLNFKAELRQVTLQRVEKRDNLLDEKSTTLE